jgi:D-erythronate 2-dehydrogenase
MGGDGAASCRLSGVKILITGAAGFVGGLLARTLLSRAALAGREIRSLVLADRIPPSPELSRDPRVEVLEGPLLEACDAIGRARFDGVFHLASAVSAECELDFDLGLASNLMTTQALLAALRAAGNAPRLVFSSSAAVFGADPPLWSVPSLVEDQTLPTPQTSYGAQKLMLEQLIMDYTRKGFLDGRSLRLLTVSVRPGRPNGAASGFLSAIVREPLAGVETTCPVALDTRVALASPAKTIAALISVYEASRQALGASSALNLPALELTVGGMLDSLAAVAGERVRGLVHLAVDARIEAIVSSWPGRFRAERARRLGLTPDPSFESIIEAYVADHPEAVLVPLQARPQAQGTR